MERNLIYIPYAYEQKKETGVNIRGGYAQKKEIYLKNACVALLSAKHYNPDCTVALVTNLQTIPSQYQTLLQKNGVEIWYYSYECFTFPHDYKWSLAFYKLCALKHVSQLEYKRICYFDTDVYIQGSLKSMWEECENNILLYDINHGLDTKDYQIMCDEIKEFLGKKQLLTHYGGEFFAANMDDAKNFVAECYEVYISMKNNTFRTSRGDEFILSIAAENMKLRIKNAAAYVCRYWTGVGFRLVSTNYKYNRIAVLHLPAEKQRGILHLYKKYISKGIIPSDRIVWRAVHLNHIPLLDRIKGLLLPAMALLRE